MKAWTVSDTESYEGGCTVVFAETRGKAHALALHTDCCEDADWNDVRVIRNPAMDKMYRGKDEMDWYEPEDRIALVKECGWFCLYVDREYCEKCPAAEWCDDYQEWKKEEKEREMNDTVYRQDAIACVNRVRFGMDEMAFGIATTALLELPPAEPEPAIPLSWIENHVNWLKSLDNSFSTLTALQIDVMVKKWRGEQDDNDKRPEGKE